jgi:anthranilate phosphoribosyltransferase
MKDVFKLLLEGKRLNSNESQLIMNGILDEKFNKSEIAALLTTFINRPIELQELEGFRSALLNSVEKINFGELETIDLCGTGGDGKNTFNISTISSFIVAASGAKVTKHGNNGITGKLGSSSIMNALGYIFRHEENRLQEELDRANITFFHSPLFYYGLELVHEVRRELGIKTFFNLLGPLINPCRPTYQLTGVNTYNDFYLYRNILNNTTSNYRVTMSHDKCNEISLCSNFTIGFKGGQTIYEPEELGLMRTTPEDLVAGNTLSDNVNLFKTILSGNGTKAQTDIISVNAGLGIGLYHNCSFKDGIKEAKDLLLGGKGIEVLNKLIK